MTQARVASPEALEMLKSFSATEFDDHALLQIVARRGDLASLYAPRTQRALQRFSPRVSNVLVGGVSCLQVLPEQGDTRGTLLYCFGGGYVVGSALQDMSIIAALAHFAQLRVVAVNYRLAPEHPWPAAQDDAIAVYTALSAQAQVNGQGLVLAGESAGGNLALSLALRAQRVGLPAPLALALLSPWCDINLDNDYGSNTPAFDPSLNVAQLRAGARAFVGQAPFDHPEISPIHANFTAAFPPTLITSGTRDRFLPECQQLTRKLETVGVPVELSVWPDLWHVFEFYDEVPEAEQSLQAIAAFLARHLGNR